MNDATKEGHFLLLGCSASVFLFVLSLEFGFWDASLMTWEDLHEFDAPFLSFRFLLIV